MDVTYNDSGVEETFAPELIRTDQIGLGEAGAVAHVGGTVIASPPTRPSPGPGATLAEAIVELADFAEGLRWTERVAGGIRVGHLHFRGAIFTPWAGSWRALLKAAAEVCYLGVNNLGRFAVDDSVSAAGYPGRARVRGVGREKLQVLVADQAAEFRAAREQENRTGQPAQCLSEVETFIAAAVHERLGRARVHGGDVGERQTCVCFAGSGV
jgi:hypothetical protein